MTNSCRFSICSKSTFHILCLLIKYLVICVYLIHLQHYAIHNTKRKSGFFSKCKFSAPEKAKVCNCSQTVSFSSVLHGCTFCLSGTPPPKLHQKYQVQVKLSLAMLPSQVFSAVHLYSQHEYYSFRAGEEAIIIVRKYDI